MPDFPGLVPGGHWNTKIGKAETDKIAKKKKVHSLSQWMILTHLS